MKLRIAEYCSASVLLSGSVPASAIDLADNSPLSLSGDDTSQGDSSSAGKFYAPIMVPGEDPTSDDVYGTDVRHRIFDLL